MVDEGFLTPEQLSIALAEQARTERPLGAILVELGFVSAGAVANALAEQHGGLLKTEFGVSAGLYALPGGATRQAAAAAALDPSEARARELETQLQAVLRERNAMAQRLNDQAVRLTEAEQAAEAHKAKLEKALAGRDELEGAVGRDELDARLSEAAEAQAAEVARVTDAAAAHIAGLEAEHESALAGRNELISQLQRELQALREAGEKQDTQADEAQAAEVARVTDAAAAHIAGLEADLAGRDEAIAQLQNELAELREQAEQLQAEQSQDDEAAEPEPAGGYAHLLFIPSVSGYALIEFAGPDPPSGTLLEVDGVNYVVRRVGPSPFPGTRLRCVFLEPV